MREPVAEGVGDYDARWTGAPFVSAVRDLDDPSWTG
jgi:hypothetical protein